MSEPRDGPRIERRDPRKAEAVRESQRELAGRLVVSALRDRDTAREAAEHTRTATFLAAASRDLAMSLDEEQTRAVMRHCTLPRADSWCFVDIIEPDGAIHRLAVKHRDPAKQELVRHLASIWYPDSDEEAGVPFLSHRAGFEPLVLNHDSSLLVAAAHGVASLEILRAVGFGSLLVVPLVAHGRVLGAMTFVSRHGDTPFTEDEIALAADLAGRCALALESARLYRIADSLRSAAEAANLAKSAFLGNMSHELRTPLNAIGGYVELMALGIRGPVTPEQEHDLARIKANQQHLLGMIAEILDFAHAQRDAAARFVSPIQVHSALDEAAETVAAVFRDRGLDLTFGPCDRDATVMADPGRLRQILTNLLTNAAKYTNAPTAGGSCTIALGCTVLRDVVNITVKDCGIGIPTSEYEAIFEPFTQLLSGLTNRQGGVGLGLPISRDFARAMGGDIVVSSAVGEGSLFTVTLPLALPAFRA